jgi:adenosine deaminase
VAHAGEEGPPEYVWEALDMLDVDRIDHGNRSLEDEALTEAAGGARDDAHRLPAVQPQALRRSDMATHPIDAMLRKGLRATINSDDPAYFGGYVNDNYRAAAAGRNLSRDDLATLARNSFLGAFLSEGEKAAHLARLDAYLTAT